MQGGKGRFEIVKLGSLAFILDGPKSDLDLLIVVYHGTNNANQLLCAQTGKNGVGPVSKTESLCHPMSAPRFDVCCSTGSPYRFEGKQMADHTEAMVMRRDKEHGTQYSSGLRLFKVLTWGCKAHAHHKTALGKNFKSITQMFWGMAVLDLVASTLTTPTQIFKFLVHAFVSFPFGTHATHQSGDGRNTE